MAVRTLGDRRSSMDELVTSAKGAAQSIKSAIAAGKEIESVVTDIQKLGVAEIQAKQQFQKKQRVVKGDTTILTAFAEWRRLKEIKEAEDDLYQQLVERYGKEKADYEWKDIQSIKERQIKEVKDGRDEMGRDLKKLRELKIMCFIASLIIVTTYYIFKGHL
jgi:hypothetical protein